jgi:hypothetical protein
LCNLILRHFGRYGTVFWLVLRWGSLLILPRLRAGKWGKLVDLVQWRFSPSQEEQALYAAHLEQIHNLEPLAQLVDQLLTLSTQAEFAKVLQPYVPPREKQP